MSDFTFLFPKFDTMSFSWLKLSMETYRNIPMWIEVKVLWSVSPLLSDYLNIGSRLPFKRISNIYFDIINKFVRTLSLSLFVIINRSSLNNVIHDSVYIN